MNFTETDRIASELDNIPAMVNNIFDRIETENECVRIIEVYRRDGVLIARKPLGIPVLDHTRDM